VSGLAAVLAGRVPRGAYLWHANFEVDDVRRTVEHAGRPFAYVDGVGVESVPELHTALAAALGFPGWYGRNLDALNDALRSVPGETVLLFDAWSAVARAEPRVFAIAVELLGGSLSLLLRGDGPETGLPSLD
jgi:hypothetical protein